MACTVRMKQSDKQVFPWLSHLHSSLVLSHRKIHSKLQHLQDMEKDYNCYNTHSTIMWCANMLFPEGWAPQDQMLSGMTGRWGRRRNSQRRCTGQMLSICIQGGWSPTDASGGLSGHVSSKTKFKAQSKFYCISNISMHQGDSQSGSGGGCFLWISLDVRNQHCWRKRAPITSKF